MWDDFRSRIKMLTYFSVAVLLAYVGYLAGSPRIEIAGGPVVQLAEQQTVNPQVVDSIPTQPTITFVPTTTTATTTTTTTIVVPRTTTTIVVPRTTTTTSTVPPSRSTNSMTGREYRYFERSLEVTALQMELGMRSVDGVYGPQTRKAHVDALGGPHALLYRNYPEIGQTPTPCSHGCLPGDGHYELPTLGALIDEYFKPEDRALAHMIAFCESSGQAHDIGSEEVSDALAVGWFQHLARYWQERSEKAGFKDYDPFNGRANVAVAAWLFYDSGVHHWNPSKGCWGETANGQTL